MVAFSKFSGIPSEVMGFSSQWLEKKDQVKMRLICKKFLAIIDLVVASGWAIDLHLRETDTRSVDHIPSIFASIPSLSIRFLLAKLPKVVFTLQRTFELTSVSLSCMGLYIRRGAGTPSLIDQLITLAEGGHFKKLNCLNLPRCFLDDGNVTKLVQSSHFANISSLNVGDNLFRIAGVRALAASPNLANLRHLDLSRNGLTDESVSILANSPHLTSLTTLIMIENGISDAGLITCASTAQFTSLTTLMLEANAFGDNGVKALCESPHLTNLTELGLRVNRIELNIPQCRCQFKNLTKLDVSYLPRLDVAGIAFLADSHNFENLTELNMEGIQSPLDAEALQTLVGARHLTNLTSLNVSGFRPFGLRSAKALASSPHFQNLSKLKMSEELFGDRLRAKAFLRLPRLSISFD